LLVATAGHVDHGKTSLVKRLTGTDTDRLAEEKARGLTIELGYAFAHGGTNGSIGFIDVPGHHRFINTMISGINGIDLGMLVVAADDGPMPQTTEHIQLLQLLGIERFLGVITKCDRVDPRRLAEVAQLTSDLLPPGAPVCAVSNRSGEGLDTLRSMLATAALSCPQRATQGLFRLYVDRVFTKKGAGMVVTGTCLAGSVAVGDELRLHVTGTGNTRVHSVRVRDIHAQGQPATQGLAGQRCALNIAGRVSLEQVHRGDFLCAHSTAAPSRRMDTRCWPAAGSPPSLKHLGRVKLYIGTRRIPARTYLLDRETGGPGGQRIQLILDGEVLAFAGDRFILRDDQETTTLGGGVVIDPEAPQWGKLRTSRLRQLDAIEQQTPEAALRALLSQTGEVSSLRRCMRIWNLAPAEMDQMRDQFGFRGRDTKQVHKACLTGDAVTNRAP